MQYTNNFSIVSIKYDNHTRNTIVRIVCEDTGEIFEGMGKECLAVLKVSRCSMIFHSCSIVCATCVWVSSSIIQNNAIKEKRKNFFILHFYAASSIIMLCFWHKAFSCVKGADKRNLSSMIFMGMLSVAAPVRGGDFYFVRCRTWKHG